jgi:hypothetical protein
MTSLLIVLGLVVSWAVDALFEPRRILREATFRWQTLAVVGMGQGMHRGAGFQVSSSGEVSEMDPESVGSKLVLRLREGIHVKARRLFWVFRRAPMMGVVERLRTDATVKTADVQGDGYLVRFHFSESTCSIVRPTKRET